MSVTTKECQAMRLLARDGWTCAALKMTFALSRKRNVKYHVEGDCAHEHGVTTIRDWDGETPPASDSAANRM